MLVVEETACKFSFQGVICVWLEKLCSERKEECFKIKWCNSAGQQQEKPEKGQEA